MTDAVRYALAAMIALSILSSCDGCDDDDDEGQGPDDDDGDDDMDDDDEDDDDAEPRSFYLSAAPMQYEMGDWYINTVFDTSFFAGNIDVISLHMDFFGLPWEAFMAGEDPPEGWVDLMGDIRDQSEDLGGDGRDGSRRGPEALDAGLAGVARKAGRDLT